MAKLVSKTYGEALYEVAVEAGKTSELMEESAVWKRYWHLILSSTS